MSDAIAYAIAAEQNRRHITTDADGITWAPCRCGNLHRTDQMNTWRTLDTVLIGLPGSPAAEIRPLAHEIAF